jgi:heme-degrading monooxygenase HmoA
MSRAKSAQAAPKEGVAFVPPTGCYAVIFSSLRQNDDGTAYGAAAVHMMDLAVKQPGYLGSVSARSPGAEGITVSYWRTQADIAAWKAQADHAMAQKKGMEDWYSAYSLVVAQVERGHAFAKPSPP